MYVSQKDGVVTATGKRYDTSMASAQKGAERSRAACFAYRLNNNVSRPTRAAALAPAPASLIRRLSSGREVESRLRTKKDADRTRYGVARGPSSRLCDRRIDILRSLTLSRVQIDTEYDYPESNEGVTFSRATSRASTQIL